jgi:hypothetical protein
MNSLDTNTDRIFDGYPDTDRISDGYKYEYGYILNDKNNICIIRKYILSFDRIINYKK